MQLRILTIGDIVGAPGRAVLRKHLKTLRQERGVDLVIANAENVTKGSGITAEHARHVFDSGVDAITGGDHVWRRSEAIQLVENDARVLRAANFSRQAPGRGYTVLPTAKGIDVGLVHLVGRVFMAPIDCPFEAGAAAVAALRAKSRVIVVEMHCEATSEKIAMGRFLDGKVSVVFGTHTHVPTADVQILPGGTGYITDVGMTGPYDSVLGRRTDRVLKRFVTGMPSSFDVAEGDARIGAALFTVDAESGRCQEAERVEVRD
ncbi:MAG: TIGR00282 family metallophosphoesterase [Planctomycetes bacterium]|nr:TIGR00282 family metallophosphoesterase [Planctomycetota bacterium]